MTKPERPAPRINKRLRRLMRKPSLAWGKVGDPRHQSWVKIPFRATINALFVGMLIATKTLRDLERLTEKATGMLKSLVPRRISDSTFDALLRRLDPTHFLAHLVMQVKEMARSKLLMPEHGLPPVLTVDGKCIAVADEDLDGHGQRRDHGTKLDFLHRVLRGTLTSVAHKPCIYQTSIPSHTNDMGAFERFLEEVVAAYERLDLFHIIDCDAGFTSWDNATLIIKRGFAYILGLKENQPELLKEARRLIAPLLDGPPEAETPWERRGGAHIQRRLYRSFDIEGYNGWDHARQVWLVLQETKRKDGTRILEERFFITSIAKGSVKPMQILAIVRNHWAVENDTFNSLDLQWREDEMPWCKQGNALLVLSLLRLIAYNINQYLRKRCLRRKHEGRWLEPPMSWRTLFEELGEGIRMRGMHQDGALEWGRCVA